MKTLKLKRKDQNIWYTSDLHFSHKALCKGTSKWEDKSDCRDFDSIESMNDTILDSINKYVKENDVLFILGDFHLGPNSELESLRNKINCKNIHFIFGNHDHYLKEHLEFSNKLFTTVQFYKEIKVDDLLICLFHYKQYIWNSSHENSTSLYGHSHGDAEYIEHGKSMDVGVDNAFRILKEWRPFSHDEVMELLKDRSFETIDHHKPHIDKLLEKKNNE